MVESRGIIPFTTIAFTKSVSFSSTKNDAIQLCRRPNCDTPCNFQTCNSKSFFSRHAVFSKNRPLLASNYIWNIRKILHSNVEKYPKRFVSGKTVYFLTVFAKLYEKLASNYISKTKGI